MNDDYHVKLSDLLAVLQCIEKVKLYHKQNKNMLKHICTLSLLFNVAVKCNACKNVKI